MPDLFRYKIASTTNPVLKIGVGFDKKRRSLFAVIGNHCYVARFR